MHLPPLSSNIVRTPLVVRLIFVRICNDIVRHFDNPLLL